MKPEKYNERELTKDMSIKELLQTLEIMQAEVEWNYLLDYAIVLEKITEIIKQNQWVDVNDKLPEEDGKYIVYCGRNYITTLNFTLDAYKVDRFDFARYKRTKTPVFYAHDSEYGFYDIDDVTHWMPLPKLPEELLKE